MPDPGIDQASVRFLHEGGDWRAEATWTEPGFAIVAVTIAHAAGAPPSLRKWPVAPGALHRLDEAIADLPSAQPAGSGRTYTLEVGGMVRATWNPDQETIVLRRVGDAVEAAAHLAFTVACTLLAQGRLLRERGQFDEASYAFRLGITALGSRYVRPGMIDDTRMKLLLADIKGREGDASGAAAVLERVLEARTETYARNTSLPQ